MKTILASILAVAFLASTPVFAADTPPARQGRQGRQEEGRQEDKDDKKKDDKREERRRRLVRAKRASPDPLPTASPGGEGFRIRATA